MSIFQHFRNEYTASLYLEAQIWREEIACPHCHETTRIGRLNGFSTTTGTWKCYSCKKPFSARRNTFFEGSHIPLHAWFQGIYLLAGANFLIGSKRLASVLGLSLRSSRQIKIKSQLPFGIEGQLSLPFSLSNGQDAQSIPAENLIGLRKVQEGASLIAELSTGVNGYGVVSDTLHCAKIINDAIKPVVTSGTSVLRFKRFTEAIAGYDIQRTDAAFLYILSRLLLSGESHKSRDAEVTSSAPVR